VTIRVMLNQDTSNNFGYITVLWPVGVSVNSTHLGGRYHDAVTYYQIAPLSTLRLVVDKGFCLFFDGGAFAIV
jgi:hypothetical protein